MTPLPALAPSATTTNAHAARAAAATSSAQRVVAHAGEVGVHCQEREEPLSASLRGHQPCARVIFARCDAAIIAHERAVEKLGQRDVDAEELMDAVRHALDQHGALDEVQVRSVATGLTDVMRLVFPSESQEIKVGDVTALGLDISSSSFGRSAVHVKGLLWRLVCTNGLKMPERQSGFSFRHVGDAQRLRDGITEAIPTVLTHTRGTMDRWRQAVGVMVDDVADMIAGMRELTSAERDSVEQELLQETSLPALPESTDAYNLVNAITGAARQAEPARRLEMESFAGQVLHQHVA